ncbi:MAG: crossover junction endodeoxyribonuclease RuvC [Chitinophagaceae bacterium]|nr:crossover junction endodeoxyribonuclease RuvC [Chitinophagaceae bacterium]
MQKKTEIILGVDPGTIVMGYGLIEIKNNKPLLLELGVLKPGKVSDTYKKLQLIFNAVSGLITKYQPTSFAIEAPFFGKNVQSMLKLGRAQGVAIAAAMRHGLDVTEYSPKKVKQSVTGNGNADKQQVMKMLQHILQFTEEPKYYDATDALAVAVCHHFQNGTTTAKSTTKKPKAKGWDDFVKSNPDRVKKK